MIENDEKDASLPTLSSTPLKEDLPVEDPKLEASISQVQELIKIWQTYYRLLMAAFDKSKELPPDAEEQFQRVKNVVAERHDQFSEVITKDHYVAQNILQMVKRTISIRDFEKASDVANDKTLMEWHEANILLFETLGSLEFMKHKLSKVSETEHKKADRKQKRLAAWAKLRANKELYAVLKYGLILAALVALWFSPIRTWFVEIPFVTKRINDFRDIFGMEPLAGTGAADRKEALTPQELDKYVGRYRNEGKVLNMRKEGSTLRIDFPDGTTSPLTGQSPTSFTAVIEGPASFNLNEGGFPVSMQLRWSGKSRRWERLAG